MTTQSVVLLLVFLAVLLALAYPLGILLTRVGQGGAVDSHELAGFDGDRVVHQNICKFL